MNNDELQKRNKTLERRWRIVLILAVIFVLTRPVALYVVRHFIHKAANDAVNNEYPLLDPAQKFIGQKNYIINLEDLRAYLIDLGKQYPDSLTIYYEQINSGANISVNRDLRFYPASLSKLVLAILAAHKVETGDWAWDKKFTPVPADLSSNYGDLYKTIGTTPTSLETLVMEMISHSDNTAQNILRRNVALEDYTSFQQETGLEDLYNESGNISAKEYTRILRVLYTSSFLEPKNSEKILKYMSESTFHEYLSQGIPSNITFAHKFGENKEQSIFADSGIVYDDGHPYMLTVLIHGKDSSDETRNWAKGIMKGISEKAYGVGK